MKKLLSLTTAFALAAGMTVSAALPLVNNSALGENAPLPQTEGNLKIAKNLPKGAAPKIAKKSPSKISIDDLLGGSTIVTEVPEDANVVSYSRSTELSYYYSYYGLGYESVEGNLTELAFTEDGTVYFKNPIVEFETDSYLKGTLKDGIVTFELPQPILDYYGTTYYADIQNIAIDWDEGTLESEEIENQTLQFKYEDGVLTSLLGEGEYLALSSKAGDWAGYGDAGIVLTPFTQEALTDVNLEGKAYNFIYDGGGHEITVAQDGDNLYIKGIIEAAPDAWIVGTKSGDNKYVFEPQYVGVISSSPAYVIAATSEEVSYYYEDWDYWYTYTAYHPAGNVEIYYDAEKDVYTVADGKLVVAYTQTEFEEDEEFYYPLAAYANGYTTIPGDVENATPSTPIINNFYDYFEESGEYMIQFSLNVVSVEGQILDINKLYYNILFDGEPVTFYSDIYEVDEDTTDIPFTYTSDYDFYSYSGGVLVSIYQDGFDEIGVQAVYRPTEDKEIRSGISTYNLATGETTGVNGISLDKSVKSTVYYDIQGRRVANPSNGLYIQKVTYNDGSVKVSKIAK